MNLMELDYDAKMLSIQPEIIIREAKPFMELMMECKCALMEVETKLNVLNAEFALKYNRNPFESIKSRIKSPMSIVEKLKRKGYPLTVESMERNLFDIAGIRVICSFVDDIYAIAALLVQQDDITLLEAKDYIKSPKENGYRSLHLILEVPVFLAEKKKPMKVEVQFRTIAMDFWASLEHKLKYKKDISDAKEIFEELQECADIISNMDLRMQEIRNRIEEREDTNP
ncbi:putative GTP pyrophosphokinase [[Clostridium] propionicum DSM 1682]|uniref:GTP pyrophosphokinase n=2 Tax=Anaerotignum propionicum TaxID=28446 RepID=A0A120MK40_ANAPI|nr:GTP pyrophosphokinase family protein [Anaerotignum propionicum]AMJ40088.1 GTP pyrophosphokinase YwaC [Anaerotignum propionicum DSM 1682]SHE80378.1 putative GTP pyrophosphokinase [[Clostridium] propionicum DSM 1682] [Anaerotignum propionicum DSM 1682]